MIIKYIDLLIIYVEWCIFGYLDMLFVDEILDYDFSVILWVNFRFLFLYCKEK